MSAQPLFDHYRERSAFGEFAFGLLDAIDFAAEKHHKRRRKDLGASLHIHHCLAVAGLLVDDGEDDLLVLKAAILHDILDATRTKSWQVAEVFSTEVTALVLLVAGHEAAIPGWLALRHPVPWAKMLQQADLIKKAVATCRLMQMARPPADWSVRRVRVYFDNTKKAVEALPPVGGPLLQGRFESAFAGRP
jgi:guanosine-3',5'-bis(diphosphate) 3'-pyrophosphohydrolase